MAYGTESLADGRKGASIGATGPGPCGKARGGNGGNGGNGGRGGKAPSSRKRRRSANGTGAESAAGGAAGKAGRRAGGRSLYDEVTARIVAELEAGRVPWVQPWDAATFAPGLPVNADSGRGYSGINILILWSEATARGFGAQRWLTFRQALAVGGNVCKGEKGTTIFYAARFTPNDGGEAGHGKESGAGTGAGSASAIGSEGDRSIPFLKRFTVFNVDQCEGLPGRCVAASAPLCPREAIPHAEALIAASGADFRVGGNEAYYSPSHDYVAVPPQQAFREQIDYYRTALHELGHWTGHGSRLGRDQAGPFGSAAYGREELCAELASAFLCAALGIVPTVRHADYVGAWLAIMRADTRAIFKAASLASKAAEYLLGIAPGVPGEAARGADAAGAGA